MKKLQVPENISLRWEAWRGFGRPELVKTLAITGIVTALASVYAAIAGLEAGMILVTMTAMFTFAFCMGLFSKLENNQSIYDFFVRRAAFRREQQAFYYRRKEGVYCIVTEETETESQTADGSGIC